MYRGESDPWWAIPRELQPRALGHTIVPDLSADRYGSCSMFVEMDNLATKPPSRYDGLVARLAISTYVSLLSIYIQNGWITWPESSLLTINLRLLFCIGGIISTLPFQNAWLEGGIIWTGEQQTLFQISLGCEILMNIKCRHWKEAISNA